MRRLSPILLLALMSVMAPRPAAALPHQGTTGVGFVIGDPLGPRFKTWLSRTQAVDAGFGVGDDVAFYGDLTWTGWNVFPKPERGRFSGSIGLGPRYEARHHRRDTFGVRFPGVVSYWVDNAPVELYFELVPVIRLAPDLGSDIDAGIGINYYFN